MNKEIDTKVLRIGGNFDTALSGHYELRAPAILKEAFMLTKSHFKTFAPLVLIYIMTESFLVACLFSAQFHDVAFMSQYLNAGFNNDLSKVDPIQLKNMLSSLIISLVVVKCIMIPFYASMSMMGLNHAVGVQSKLSHLAIGFIRFLPIMLLGATITLIIVLFLVLSMILPSPFVFLSLVLMFYFFICFSLAPLMFYQNKFTILEVLLYCVRAINKKLFSVLLIVINLMCLYFLFATVTNIIFAMFPFGLFIYIIIVPLVATMVVLNTIGIVYREMFGVRLQVVQVTVAEPTHIEPEIALNKTSESIEEPVQAKDPLVKLNDDDSSEEVVQDDVAQQDKKATDNLVNDIIKNTNGTQGKFDA